MSCLSPLRFDLRGAEERRRIGSQVAQLMTSSDAATPLGAPKEVCRFGAIPHAEDLVGCPKVLLDGRFGDTDSIICTVLGRSRVLAERPQQCAWNYTENHP
jgi:hypothetical protein